MIQTNFLQSWRKPLVIVGFVNDEEPSLTVPDDSYSIRDILNQFTSGINPPVNEYNQYDGDNPDFEDIDLLTTFGDLSDYDSARLAQLERVVNAKKREQQAREFNRVVVTSSSNVAGGTPAHGAAATVEGEVSNPEGSAAPSENA